MNIQHTDIDVAINELAHLTSEELQNLCDSTSIEEYDKLLGQSDKIKKLTDEYQALLSSVKTLAKRNLNCRTEYESKLALLLDKVIDSKKLKDGIKEIFTKLIDLYAKRAKKSDLNVLQAATNVADIESDNVAKEFLHSSLKCDAFINQFLDKKRLANIRRIKLDKLRQNINIPELSMTFKRL